MKKVCAGNIVAFYLLTAMQPEIDEETNEWVVPSEFQEEMDNLKDTHKAEPLKVYMGQQFIEPLNVQGALENALVEVHFTIQHYRIRRESAIDSFSAVIQQVLILKPGVGKSESPYKRKSFRDGPLKAPGPNAQSKNHVAGDILDDPFVLSSPREPVAGPSRSQTNDEREWSRR